MIKVATDAGGTFTDLVAFEESLRQDIPRQGPDYSQGSLTRCHRLDRPKSRNRASHDRGLLLRSWRTTVINAITERKGVRTAVVTTDGFRDVIAIGRNRPDLYNLHSKPPEPFVPRHLRFEVIERIDAMGNVRTPLSMKTVDAAADAIAAAGVEAVAVTFLHAYINPAHEAAAAARLRELLPGVAVTASHEISRQWREYERSNTAVLSAYVQPIIAHYLANLSLKRRGTPASLVRAIACSRAAGLPTLRKPKWRRWCSSNPVRLAALPDLSQRRLFIG